MRKMKFASWGMACLLGGCLSLVSCQQEETASLVPEGKGAIRLSLAADTGFGIKTKAVDENNYLTARPLSNYKVRILKEGQPVAGCDWTYDQVPTGLIELNNGSYTVEAYDGEEFNRDASTRDGIYMYGSTEFEVNSSQKEEQTVVCKPACGKLQVNFGAGMDTYFSEYSVLFKTKAAGEKGFLAWTKADKDPLYIKLNKAGETVTASFSFTRKDGTAQKEVTVAPREMKWGSSWTLNVNPKVSETTGMKITISFDDSTNDVSHTIEIPSDWL